MKTYCRVLIIISILVVSIFAAGCGGGGGGSGYVAPTGESLSGSVVLPADMVATMAANIVANVSFSGMKVHLLDINDNDIVSPVELGSTGAFSFPGVPAGSNYQLVLITPAGKKLLRKHIDSFSEAVSSVNINSESTAIAILVKQSNFEKSETNLSEVISPAVISSLVEKITEWLKGNSPSTENDIFAVVIAVVGESEIEKIIDNAPDAAGYSVIYDGNGNTAGAIPIDSLTYQQSNAVTVKDNAGSLAKTGYTFAGWNTLTDGKGIDYLPGQTFAIGNKDAVLYAKWLPCSISPSWFFQAGSSNNDIGNKIEFDPAGNIMFSGCTDGVFDGIAPTNLREVFIKSVSQEGVSLWSKLLTKQYPAHRNWSVEGFKLSDNSEFVVAELTTRFHLAKFNLTGALVWEKSLSVGFDVYPGAIVTSGNFIYATGSTEGSLDGFTQPNGGDDVFVVKLDSSGETVWLKQIASPYGWERGCGISVDASGNVFVSGSTNGCIDSVTTPSGNNIFLAKLSPNGEILWVKQIPGSEHSIGHKSDSLGNIFIVGAYGRLIKFDSNGNLIFHKSFQTSDFHAVRAMDLKGDNIFVVGGSNKSISGIVNENPNASNISGYWLKTDGSFVAELFLGTSAQDTANDVAFYDTNTVFITGLTSGSLPGCKNSGKEDAFLMKALLIE